MRKALDLGRCEVWERFLQQELDLLNVVGLVGEAVLGFGDVALSTKTSD